jgi:hypothetical protein
LWGEQSGWQAEEETDPQTQAQAAVEGPTWIDEDGLHALLPGTKPDPQMMEELTRRYQEHIRRSPLWDEMVREFGLERAEQLLHELALIGISRGVDASGS